MKRRKTSSADNSEVRFATTSWNRVLLAGNGDEESRGEFATLCRDYWYPLYAFLRRSGTKAEDAEDTVQAIFAWLIESDFVQRADPARGRFRNFLMVSLRQFQAREHQFQAAAKRRPTKPVLSIDSLESDSRYQLLGPAETPETLFEKAWAISLIERSMQQLQAEMAAAGKGAQFDCLRGMLTGQRDLSGREAAERLGMNEGVVRVAVHRMEQRYGELLRQHVAATVERDEDVDDELRALFAKVSQ
jgi:DNA-directed RNA polymerase specialized sigma24 family protein